MMLLSRAAEKAQPHARESRILLHVVLALFLAADGIAAITALIQNPSLSGCTSKVADQPLPNWGLVIWGVVFIGVGAFSGLLQFLREWPGENTRGAKVQIQVALLCLFVILGCALVYESIGVMKAAGQEPITFYVRCLAILGLSGGLVGNFFAYSLVCTICFLVGHWLLAWRGGAALVEEQVQNRTGAPRRRERP
jgi:hypothetical protein